MWKGYNLWNKKLKQQLPPTKEYIKKQNKQTNDKTKTRQKRKIYLENTEFIEVLVLIYSLYSEAALLQKLADHTN